MLSQKNIKKKFKKEWHEIMFSVGLKVSTIKVVVSDQIVLLLLLNKGGQMPKHEQSKA